MEPIQFNKLILPLMHLKLRDLLKLSLLRVCSVNHYYVLKRSLAKPFPSGVRTVVTLRKICRADMKEMLDSLKGLDGESRQQMIARLLFLKAGFTNCYVARTKSNEIAFLQWLVFPSENPLIRKHFSRRFSELQDGQVMIENAFTFPKFRGFGLLPTITRRLLMLAKENGHGAAITYIRKDKIASLNEFLKMNFKIIKLIKEYRLMGITIRKL